jgi:hypothetical protein
LAIEDDYAVDNVPAKNASQGKDSASSLIDDFGHSQAGTAVALHNLSLLHGCELRGPVTVVSLAGSQPGACPFSWQEGTSAGSQVREGGAAGLQCAGMVVKVSGIELIPGRFLLDNGETGDAVE